MLADGCGSRVRALQAGTWPRAAALMESGKGIVVGSQMCSQGRALRRGVFTRSQLIGSPLQQAPSLPV